MQIGASYIISLPIPQTKAIPIHFTHKAVAAVRQPDVWIVAKTQYLSNTDQCIKYLKYISYNLEKRWSNSSVN